MSTGGYSASSVRRSGPGVPYYNAYRQNNQFQKSYTPTLGGEDYAKAQEARNEKYFQYLRERDPKKRAQLYREYQQDRGRIARDLAGSRTGYGRARAGGPRVGDGGPGIGDAARVLAVGLHGPRTRPRHGVGPVDPVQPPVAEGPGRPGPSAEGSPSELLQRSDLMDRANRAAGRTAPSAPPRRDRAPGLLP